MSKTHVDEDEKQTPGSVQVIDPTDETAYEPIEIDPEVEKRVVRKIDRTILIIFSFIYMWQYLDKIALSYAVIFGMREDLNFQGQDYSWVSSIFYFGQFFFEWPATWLLHRFPIKHFVAVTIIAWGAVMMSLAATQNFKGMMIARFFLGAAEGAVAPAFVVLTSIWWRKKEHPIRLACFVSANAVAQIVGSLLLYGCGSISNAAISGWRISFLIAGSVTMVLGVIFATIIPVTPRTAWFLTPEERIVAVQRVAQEHASAQHSKFSTEQAIQTLKDPKFWLVFLWAFLICITSVVTFGSIIINGLGYNSFRTIVIGLPGPAMQLATIWIGVTLCWLLPNQRGLIQTGLLSVPLVGVIVLKTLPYDRTWGLVVAYWMATCNSSVFVINISLISSNFKGHTRKSMTSIAYFIGYAVGCICGPQLFISSEKPLYPTAMVTIIVMYIIFIVSQLAYRQLCAFENRKRDRMAAEGIEEAVPRKATDEDNVTDVDDLRFRYVL